MKISEILLEDIEFITSPEVLRKLLADVQQEMEEVDDASMGSEQGDAKHAGLSRDYSALLAVENVIRNHLKALKNNVMDQNIFMYDNYDYAGEIAAIHVAIEGPVAHVKWLGSYNGQGGPLYRAAMKEAIRRGATSVEVEAKWNSDGFYRKMGLDTTQQGEYNPFTDSQLNKMAGPLEEETLAELIGIKNKVKDLPMPRHEYDPAGEVSHTHGIAWHRIMTDHGFEPSGSGAFATVWSHPKLSYVLKLFKSSDQAYLSWVKFAMKNQNNPHMPRFISTQPVRITPLISAVRMEPLRRMETKFLRTHYISDRLLLEVSYRPSDSWARVQNLPEFPEFEKYCETHPDWLPALDLTWSFMKITGHMNDFHPGNCMMRDTDTLVITDPVL